MQAAQHCPAASIRSCDSDSSAASSSGTIDTSSASWSISSNVMLRMGGTMSRASTMERLVCACETRWKVLMHESEVPMMMLPLKVVFG